MGSERASVIDAIEVRGWRQEIRRELLCKLQQKVQRISWRVGPYRQFYCAGYFRFGSTIPILSTPLHARYRRPSGVAAMFRTTPPPDGIVARANFSDDGSNLIMVLGLTPDSLYQTPPSLVMAIPYGPESDPPGESHILTAPVAGLADQGRRSCSR